MDLSESSARVLEVAASIAGSCGAHLTVLCPYRLIDVPERGDTRSLRSRLETRIRDSFASLRKQIPALANLPCEFVAEIGFMSDRINAFVRRHPVDLVVLAQQSNGTSDFTTFDLQNLISHAQLPFVIVPAMITKNVVVDSASG